VSSVSAARFLINPSPDAADPPPSYTTNGGGLTLVDPRMSGVVLVAFSNADMAVPGSKFWRLDLIISIATVIGGFGRLHVSNT
jgi:hypothetical protein